MVKVVYFRMGLGYVFKICNMFSGPEFIKLIFEGQAHLEDLALSLFRFQYAHNSLYRDYLGALGIKADDIRSMKDIPYLPISFFKTHDVKSGDFVPELIFESSGTTGMIPSRHLVKEASLYERSFRTGFECFYGPVTDYVVIGLLPSYLERSHSSLVYMVNDMVRRSGQPESGFYLDEHEKLRDCLDVLQQAGRKVLLIGVTFGLLDFAEKYSLRLDQTIVMETGGMKGRREEWTRTEVHSFLKDRLGVQAVHSEYGMSELLSQAYSKGEGVFRCPPWMRIVLRNENDPLDVLGDPTTGVSEGLINVIDLANLYSCAFIATDDIGRLHADGSFEVLGRMDHSDLRGCSLLVS